MKLDQVYTRLEVCEGHGDVLEEIKTLISSLDIRYPGLEERVDSLENAMVDLAGTRSLGSAALEVAHDKPRPTRARELRADDDRCPSLEAHEKNCADDTKKIDQLLEIMHGIHAGLAEQEERLNTLRTELENQADVWRMVIDRVKRNY